MIDLTTAQHDYGEFYKLKYKNFTVRFEFRGDSVNVTDGNRFPSKDFSRTPKPEWWIYSIKFHHGDKKLHKDWDCNVFGGMRLKDAQEQINKKAKSFIQEYYEEFLNE